MNMKLPLRIESRGFEQAIVDASGSTIVVAPGGSFWHSATDEMVRSVNRVPAFDESLKAGQDALVQAIIQQREAQKLADAVESYRAAIRTWHERPDTVNYHGVLASEKKLDAAIAAYRATTQPAADSRESAPKSG